MNRYALAALSAVVSLVMIVVLVVMGLSSTTQAADPSGCILDISGTVGLVVCGGEVIDRLPLPTIKIKGPTVTLPGNTQTVTETATATPAPQPKETVTAPGETTTATVQAPGETTTVTAPPEPVETVTETTTAPPTRQTTPPSGNVEIPSTNQEEAPNVDFGDGRTTIQEVGIGFLTLLAIFLIVIGGMYYGWRVGRRASKDEDTAFIRSILDESKIRKRKH